MTDTQSAGATPVVGGATPPQTPTQSAPQTSTQPASPATDDQPLGDAGKRALQEEREAKRELQRLLAERDRKLEELENATKSDHEKALAQARKDAARDVEGKYVPALRRMAVRSALLEAGVNAGLVDLASRADHFASLKVNDDGNVEGLDAAIEAFRKATPDVFAPKPQRPPIDGGLGPRGASPSPSQDMNTFIRRQAGRA